MQKENSVQSVYGKITEDKLAYMKSVGIVLIPADVYYQLLAKNPGVDISRFDYYLMYNGKEMLYSIGYLERVPLADLQRRVKVWKERA